MNEPLSRADFVPKLPPAARLPGAGAVARYSRFVFLGRGLIWLLLACVLVALWWVASSNSGDGSSRLVFSAPTVSEPLQNTMLKPHFDGLDANGQPYTIAAEQAVQHDDEHVSLETIRADLATSNGGWVGLNADTGAIEVSKKFVQLRGNVTLFYDGGYEFRTPSADIDINAGTATGAEPIEGQGPSGTLNADSFTILDQGAVLQFNGSVRMTLYP